MGHALSSSDLDAVRIPNISGGAASDERRERKKESRGRERPRKKGGGGAPRALQTGGMAWDSPGDSTGLRKYLGLHYLLAQ